MAGEGRPTKRTPEKRSKFLSLLARGLTVTGAFSGAGLSRDLVYSWRKSDPQFAVDWNAAIQSGTDYLEDVALKRAKERDSILLMFLLKARNRERFSDRIGIDFSRATPEQVAAAFRQIPLEKLDGNNG